MMAEPARSKMEELYNKFQGAADFESKSILFKEMGDLQKSTVQKVQNTVDKKPLGTQEMISMQRDIGLYEKASRELSAHTAKTTDKINRMIHDNLG